MNDEYSTEAEELDDAAQELCDTVLTETLEQAVLAVSTGHEGARVSGESVLHGIRINVTVAVVVDSGVGLKDDSYTFVDRGVREYR